jgi:hypothetical protein
MTFLPLTSYDDLKPPAKAAADDHRAAYGEELTNIQATLLTNVPSFTAYMQWHRLRDEVVPWIGERAFALFSYAISDENDCAASALYFRRILVDGGDDPDNPEVTETERLLMDWGRLIARSPHDIPDAFYARLEEKFSPERRLTLLAFAGQMVATNVFNTVGRVPVDEALKAYARP